jgi:hypothetical protein
MQNGYLISSRDRKFAKALFTTLERRASAALWMCAVKLADVMTRRLLRQTATRTCASYANQTTAYLHASQPPVAAASRPLAGPHSVSAINVKLCPSPLRDDNNITDSTVKIYSQCVVMANRDAYIKQIDNS